MNSSSPWLRVLFGIVAVAAAIRLVVDLIRPVLGFLVAALVIAGLAALIRWWRNNRW